MHHRLWRTRQRCARFSLVTNVQYRHLIREFLDQKLFWSASDIERKQEAFRRYYNAHRVPASFDSDAPAEIGGEPVTHRASSHPVPVEGS